MRELVLRSKHVFIFIRQLGSGVNGLQAGSGPENSDRYSVCGMVQVVCSVYGWCDRAEGIENNAPIVGVALKNSWQATARAGCDVVRRDVEVEQILLIRKRAFGQVEREVVIVAAETEPEFVFPVADWINGHTQRR